jgi:uncharacterized YigZ family protein
MTGFLFDDTFHIPLQAAEASLRERGSRFLAFVYPVQNEAVAKSLLAQLKQQYPDATHHCYALVLGSDSAYKKASDDGEPSNSAGQPILRAILSAGLTHVLVVVIRYFGGTQLGIPGLIKAYGDSAKMALDAAGKQEQFIRLPVELTTDASAVQTLYRLLQGLEAEMAAPHYSGEQVKLLVHIRRNKESTLLQRLTDAHRVSAKWL